MNIIRKKKANDALKIFINPVITIDKESPIAHYEEACLSIMPLRINVARHTKVTVLYFDVNWQQKEEVFTDFPARAIQHEYDHLRRKIKY